MGIWRRTLLVSAFAFGGCTLMDVGADAPTESTVRREQLVIHSDFLLPKHHRLLDDLVLLRGDVYGKLDLPVSDESIEVFLFDKSQSYREFLKAKFPELPDRRAFFLKTDTRLAVYAHWGDLVAEDLRHEITHGYLHAVIPSLPLWLDEGIAEFFEIPRGRRGYHERHLALLQNASLAGTWQPNLLRLEQLSDLTQMSQRDYAEAWLWVHMMLESTPERLHLLRSQLANFRQSGTAPPLSDSLRQMEQQFDLAAVRHLNSLPPGPGPR